MEGALHDASQQNNGTGQMLYLRLHGHFHCNSFYTHSFTPVYTSKLSHGMQQLDLRASAQYSLFMCRKTVLRLLISDVYGG